MQIVLHVDLRVGLALTAVGMLAGVAIASARASSDRRRWMLRSVVTGVVAGALATAGYDVTRYTLSVFDASPYDPFEAIRRFGALLTGGSTDPATIAITGGLFHLLNGSSFGVAYVFLFARDGQTTLRRALATGFGWGLFLELFQIGLYPGWLDIRAYSEFVTISAVGHLVYGATLGAVARTLLQAWRSRAAARGARAG
jgi:hypothetical protein